MLLKKLLHVDKQQVTEHGPVDVCHVIEESLKDAKDRIIFKNARVSKHFSHCKLLYGNAEQLSVAFLNIIINAVESLPTKDGKIWIAVYQGNNEVRVVFKDNGIGMKPEICDSLFERDSPYRQEGRGFGLIHVKEILDSHNATISVNSEPGTGTSFVIGFKSLL